MLSATTYPARRSWIRIPLRGGANLYKIFSSAIYPEEQKKLELLRETIAVAEISFSTLASYFYSLG